MGKQIQYKRPLRGLHSHFYTHLQHKHQPTRMSSHAIIVLLLICIVSVWSNPHLQQLMNKREIFCGPKLTATLALLCKGTYNSPSKKSFTDLLTYNEYEELFPNEDDDQLEFPFLDKEVANSLIPLRLRRRTGIVDECCRKPCSLQHLSLYCAPAY